MAEKQLTQIEKETVLYQIDGYYNIPYGNQTHEHNFESAKAELINHLKRNIANVEKATFDMFAKYRKIKLPESGHKCENPNCNNRQLTKEFRLCNSCIAKETTKADKQLSAIDDSWVHDSDMECR